MTTHERVKVILSPASSAALDHVAEVTGDSETDVINRAIQIYAAQVDVVAGGGRVLTQDGTAPEAGGQA